jgi:hypothetical protein
MMSLEQYQENVIIVHKRDADELADEREYWQDEWENESEDNEGVPMPDDYVNIGTYTARCYGFPNLDDYWGEGDTIEAAINDFISIILEKITAPYYHVRWHVKSEHIDEFYKELEPYKSIDFWKSMPIIEE